MKRHFVSQIVILISIIFSANTYAVIIEGNFEGTVRFYYDDYDDSAWSGYWDEDIEGTTATGSFWYDTDKAAHIGSSLTASQFRSTTNEWMDFSFTIGGKTFNVSDVDPSLGMSNMLEIVTFQEYVVVTDGSLLERFFLAKNISTHSDSMQKSIHGSIQVYEYDGELLDSLRLDQEFDWADTGGRSYGRASFMMIDYLGGDGVSAMGWMEISKLEVKERGPVVVPEPSSLVMLLIGFVILGIKSNRLKVASTLGMFVAALQVRDTSLPSLIFNT